MLRGSPLILITMLVAVGPALAGPLLDRNPTDAERAALQHLRDQIDGRILFTRSRHVYVLDIDADKATDLGKGEYARWSPDGKKIAVYNRRKIIVMDADGDNRRELTDQADRRDGCPIEFHANGQEIIYLHRRKKGFHAIDIDTGKSRLLVDDHNYTGEPGISADGTRMAARAKRDLYKIDLETGRSERYVRPGCSAGISPDGKRLLNNGDNGGDTSHHKMNVRNWDGSDLRRFHNPDHIWDNHHWSNHRDYIAAQAGPKHSDEAYVFEIHSQKLIRLTWHGGVTYPDLYVEPDDKDEAEKDE